MATLAQLLAANQGGSSGLVAAALRKGLVKPDALLKPGMYDPNLDFTGQTQGLSFRQQFGQNTDPSDVATYNPGSDYNLGGSRTHEGVFGGPGRYVDPVTGQSTDYSTPGALAELLHTRDTTLQRGGEDYNTATQNLQRNYRNLGVSQGERARAQGVSHGGALAQALRKRTENQGRDQSGLDTSWRRLSDDTNYQYDTGRGRVLSGASQQQGDLDRGLGQATEQNTLFGQQLGTAKVTSAQQMGTLPDLPAPDFSPTRASAVAKANRPATNALAAAYYKRLGLPVPR